jgi:hypothetical protein
MMRVPLVWGEGAWPQRSPRRGEDASHIHFELKRTSIDVPYRPRCVASRASSPKPPHSAS